VVLCVLLVTRLVLKVVHHGHPPSTGPTIDAAMLPLLVALVKHSVEAMRRGLRVGRSGWRGCIGGEGRPDGIRWRGVPEDLVPRLGVLWEVVVPSALLRKSVTIGHLIWSARGRREALAQWDERRPLDGRRDFRIGVGGLEGGGRILLRWHIGLLGRSMEHLPRLRRGVRSVPSALEGLCDSS
jgi:hypothetical protein